ncbi:hypothetical protein ACLOJK_024428 [Asimina triloba]
MMMGTEVVVRLAIERLNHLLEGLEEVGLTGEHVEGMKIRFQLLRMAQFMRIRRAEDSIPVLEEDLKSVMPWWEWDEMVEKAQRLGEWTERLRDIAFTTEDVIDDFRLHVFHHPYLHHPNAFANLLHKCCWILRRQIHLRHLLRTRIRYIGERVFESSKQQLLLQDQDNDGLGIPPAPADHDALMRIPRWMDDDDDDINPAAAVGTDKGRDMLVQWLLEDEAELTLVAITGYKGTGITTLANQVYNTPAVKHHFDCHVWVSLTRRFRIQSMLLRMIDQFHPHTAKAGGRRRWTLRELFKQVAGYLRDKKYLIVLDDVCDRDDLNCVFHAFPDSLCGSRLMITTESYDIAICARGRICYVWPLSWEDAWEVFRRKAFPPDGVCPVEELENMAKSVVHVCDGLPLSIVVAAGFLPFQHQNKWLRIVQILRRVAASNPNPDYKVLTRLIQLSFDNLPYYLKSCLLYFCMFQEDAPIRGTRLIQLWTAEGIVQARDNKTAEEVAEECLAALIRRNLVQPSQLHEDGRLRSCQVHCLIRGQILEVAKEGDILGVAQAENSSIDETRLHSRLRRLSIQDDFDQDANLTRFRNIRSLFISGAENVPESFIQMTIASFRLLKVLVLEGIPLDEFPVGVENLLLLKYLGLRHLQISELPRSIGSLLDLETLDLKCSQISTLPGEILKLKRLRHLLVCHHTTHGVSVPKGIDTLTSLQTLGYIDVLEASGARVGELGNLISMRRMCLCITKLNRGDGNSLCSSIEKMVRLCSLKVMFRNEDQTLDLQAMSSPPADLQRLYLRGRLERCPGWVKLLHNLVKMSLSGSRLGHDPFDMLKSLPNLAVLIFVRAYEGEELCCDAGGFPSLRVLKLVELHSLEVLNVEEGGFPCLEELHIRHCPNLKKFPSSIQLWMSIMPEEAKLQLQQDREDEEDANLPIIRILTIIRYILKIAMVIATVCHSVESVLYGVDTREFPGLVLLLNLELWKKGKLESGPKGSPVEILGTWEKATIPKDCEPSSERQASYSGRVLNYLKKSLRTDASFPLLNDERTRTRMEKAETGVKKMSPCDVEALKKCLEENKGDRLKCQVQIEAFKTSCSLKKPSSPSQATQASSKLS